jgi:hypothetical protein
VQWILGVAGPLKGLLDQLAVLGMHALEHDLARQLEVRGGREDPAEAGGVAAVAGVELQLEAAGLRRRLSLGEQPLASGALLGAGERLEDERTGLGQRLGSLERLGDGALEVKPLAGPTPWFGGRLHHDYSGGLPHGNVGRRSPPCMVSANGYSLPGWRGFYPRKGRKNPGSNKWPRSVGGRSQWERVH